MGSKIHIKKQGMQHWCHCKINTEWEEIHDHWFAGVVHNSIEQQKLKNRTSYTWLGLHRKQNKQSFCESSNKFLQCRKYHHALKDDKLIITSFFLTVRMRR